jgi:hypothetical protein
MPAVSQSCLDACNNPTKHENSHNTINPARQNQRLDLFLQEEDFALAANMPIMLPPLFLSSGPAFPPASLVEALNRPSLPRLHLRRRDTPTALDSLVAQIARRTFLHAAQSTLPLTLIVPPHSDQKKK